MIDQISAWKRQIAVKLRSKGQLRISPEFPDVIEINCRFEFFPTQRVEEYWVPLSEVIATPLGHIFQTGHFEVAPLPQEIRKIRNFTPVKSVRSHQAEQNFLALSPNGEIMHSTLTAERDYWVDDAQRPPVAIAKAEYTRFVAAAFGSFADHLLDIDLDPQALFNTMCDMSETGRDGDVFRIKARAGFTDRSTLFQLALLQTEPDYLDALRRLGRGVRMSLAGDEEGLPELKPPGAGVTLKIGIDQMPDQSPPQLPLRGFAKAVTASRIISDQRKFKFKRILAELPFEFAEPSPNNDEYGSSKPGERDSKPRSYGQDLNIDPYARPGRNRPTLTISSGNIFLNFPCLRTTTFETTTQRQVERNSGARLSKAEPVTTFSPLPPAGNALIGHLQNRPSVPKLPPLEPTAWRETGDRFLDRDVILPHMVYRPYTELDPRCTSFVAAGFVLASWGQLETSLSSLSRSSERIVSMFELQREHGIWGWSTRHSRGRHMFAHVINLDGETVVALEIERLKREKYFSMGLLHTTEPVCNMEAVGRLIGRVAERNSGVHDPGTWPPRHFDDVRFATLRHCGNRDIPNRLAIDLIDKAEWLCNSAH